MNASVKMIVAVVMGWNGVAVAGEALPLPEGAPSPDAALEAMTQDASWEATLEELTLADRLVVVAAAVGDEIDLDPGFKAAHVEVEDLWIADASILRRGKAVRVSPTQPGTTRLFVADKDGWVLEYELRVEPGVEDPELAAYEVDETTDSVTPSDSETAIAEAPLPAAEEVSDTN